MFDMTRNQYFLIGFVLCLLGGEFLFVDRVELTDECTRFLFKQSSPPLAALSSGTQSVFGMSSPPIKKTIPIPERAGWLLLCLGGVPMLHALVMRGPNG